MMNTLRCDRLRKSFSGVCALADIRLQFPQSGITAIVGPNGAGKTTLINIMTGFLRPDSGRCFLGEREITRLAPHRIARLGVARTFQDLRLIQQISVLENALLACPNQKGEHLIKALLRLDVRTVETKNRVKVEQILKFVGLEDNALGLARELSYGQQKLLTLTCCLATEARILILDEPIAGVHPVMAVRILDLLRQLREQGKQIIFIEHDLGAVRQLADQIIVMDAGKVIAQGQPGEILKQREILEAYLG